MTWARLAVVLVALGMGGLIMGVQLANALSTACGMFAGMCLLGGGMALGFGLHRDDEYENEGSDHGER